MLIRVSLSLLVLLLSVGIPLLGLSDIAIFIAAIPILILSLNYVSKWAGLGMAAIIGAALMIDFQIGTGTGSSINAGMMALLAMVGLWIVNIVINRQKTVITSIETFVPLILFLIFSFISFLAGQITWYSFASETSFAAQVGGLSIFFFSALAFWWTATQVDHLRWLKYALVTLFLCAFVYYLGRTVPPNISRTFGLSVVGGAAGSMLFVWSACMALGQGLLNHKLSPYLRIVCLALPGLALYVAFFQLRGWVSGYLPLFAVLVVVYWLSFPKQGLLVCVVMFGAGLTQLQTILDRYVFIGDNSYSLGTRLDAWKIVGEITSISPILGLGPANYYNITPLFPIRGYAVQFNSHSQYVDLYAQTGIVGLILFFWFFWRAWKLGWFLRSTVEQNSFEHAYVVGAMGGVVGTLVSAALGDWVIPFVYNIGFSGFRASVLCWLCLGGLVAIKRIYRDKQLAEPMNETPSISLSSPLDQNLFGNQYKDLPDV
ncbi:MAG: O-antigen ligase family protein [Anaerolineae bacterium]